MRLVSLVCLPMLVAAASSPAIRADEIKLKDGTKIVGTIVGFEENSFKVKTSYGFAVVQKDQVVSISISSAASNPAAKPEADKKAEPAAEKPAPPAKQVNSYKNYKTNPPAADPAPAPAASPAPSAAATPPPASAAAPVPVKSPAPAASPAQTPPAAKAAPPPAPAPPPPESMRERVTGNLYMNETYGFQMYKPPTWQLVEGARSVLPGAITALGTSDETTYLLIGRQPVEKSFAADIEATDRHLRTSLENYRALGESKITVSGLPAVERRFRVSVDQRDWSGVAVFFQHDAHVYTIFGMTAANSDLVQIQENVINRAISSLEFAKR